MAGKFGYLHDLGSRQGRIGGKQDRFDGRSHICGGFLTGGILGVIFRITHEQ